MTMEIRPIMSALLRSKTGAVLIAAQVALTLAIVCNAAFVVAARLATADRPSGVDEPNLILVTYVGSRKIPDQAAMVQKDLETLRALPGVAAAAETNQMPMTRSGWGGGISVDGKPASSVGAAVYLGDDALIDALGVRVVEGRNFEAAEIRTVDETVAQVQADVVILTRHLAQTLFPDAPSVVGKTVFDGTGETARQMRVVGVIDMLMGPDGDTSPQTYDSFILPIRMLSDRAQYAIRSEPGQRSRIQASAEQALTSLRSDRVKVQNRSMDEIRTRRYRNDRTGAGMLVAVTIGLLLVTGSGIVGVASLWVSQRRKQIGVRRALGAGRIDILRYFVTENLLITTVGVVAGVGFAIALNQFLVSKLELARLPVAYLAGGVVTLWVLGVFAVLGPAWRAAAVPPAIATRGA
jgi:putative ABC transport system permease protein